MQIVTKSPRGWVRGRVSAALHEVVLLGALMLGYDAVRLLAAHRAGGAYGTAAELSRFERTLGLPDERSIQALVLPFPHVVHFADIYYKYVHFPLTVVVLAWLFARAPEHYRWARRSIIAASGVALAIYVVLPVAPPRLLTGLGMVDTATVYGDSVYGVPGARSVTNQYASMPSLHVGWALLVAVVLISASRSRFRWLWALHPVITLFVVIVTANHYWLDAFAGAFIVLTALSVFRPEALGRDAGRPALLPALRRRVPCPDRS